MSRASGAEFERVAAEFLSGRGFQIIETNYTCRAGELDLVCDHQGMLVFVEVRARRDARHGAPEETVGNAKQRRIIRAAEHYLFTRRIQDRPCRFDVVAIVGASITHFEDAFR